MNVSGEHNIWKCRNTPSPFEKESPQQMVDLTRNNAQHETCWNLIWQGFVKISLQIIDFIEFEKLQKIFIDIFKEKRNLTKWRVSWFIAIWNRS